jgi:hypothetical protein
MPNMGRKKMNQRLLQRILIVILKLSVPGTERSFGVAMMQRGGDQ